MITVKFGQREINSIHNNVYIEFTVKSGTMHIFSYCYSNKTAISLNYNCTIVLVNRRYK